jgi:NAD(P)-dependent dehydrogenase (short-subunit alcohol dehydrogenase family)
MASGDFPVTIVTGASGSLGSAVVRHLAARGHRVAAVERKKQGPAPEPAGAALTIAIDVSSSQAWTSAVERVRDELGVPTGAALIAGAWRGGARLFEPPAGGDWPAMMAANLESARVALGALLPGLVQERSGSVVLVGSRAAVRPWESANAAAYAASKAALVALAQSVAAEVLNDGVRINLVLPGTIDTPQNRAAMPKADSSRWVAPESLAEVIEFLLSPGARDVSGAAIPVYGRGGP